mmetsp:Transcript_46927/g.106419  ORF Transcript_46927/g.106419 Transcript_46927/m.106419 type:complete len:222 (+) Transcript_46927:490-1155(+)
MQTSAVPGSGASGNGGAMPAALAFIRLARSRRPNHHARGKIRAERPVSKRARSGALSDFMCVPEARTLPASFSPSPPSARRTSSSMLIMEPWMALAIRASTIRRSPARMGAFTVTPISMERPDTYPAAICPMPVTQSTSKARAPSCRRLLPAERRRPSAIMEARTVPSGVSSSIWSPASSPSKVPARRNQRMTCPANQRARARAKQFPAGGGGAFWAIQRT